MAYLYLSKGTLPTQLYGHIKSPFEMGLQKKVPHQCWSIPCGRRPKSYLWVSGDKSCDCHVMFFVAAA